MKVALILSQKEILLNLVKRWKINFYLSQGDQDLIIEDKSYRCEEWKLFQKSSDYIPSIRVIFEKCRDNVYDLRYHTGDGIDSSGYKNHELYSVLSGYITQWSHTTDILIDLLQESISNKLKEEDKEIGSLKEIKNSFIEYRTKSKHIPTMINEMCKSQKKDDELIPFSKNELEFFNKQNLEDLDESDLMYKRGNEWLFAKAIVEPYIQYLEKVVLYNQDNMALRFIDFQSKLKIDSKYAIFLIKVKDAIKNTDLIISDDCYNFKFTNIYVLAYFLEYCCIRNWSLLCTFLSLNGNPVNITSLKTAMQKHDPQKTKIVDMRKKYFTTKDMINYLRNKKEHNLKSYYA